MLNYGLMTDRELLKLVVMEKGGENITEELVKRYGSIADILVDSDESELLKIKGVGVKRVHQIKAVNELARRLYSKSADKEYKITSPRDVADLMFPEMKFLKKEYLKVLMLNTKNVVISTETVSIGSLNASIVHPREVYRTAIKKSAASIIVCHNHPSGDPTPSNEDISITKRLKECGKIIGIELLDHVIIGDGIFISLKEKGVV
jgi:DNA repair protein RadC